MEKDFRADFQPNQYYHIFNHGVGKEKLFLSAENYRYFLHLFDKHICPVAELFCYSLLPNHFHFFLVTRSELILQNRMELLRYKKMEEERTQPKFVLQQFSNFFNAYTKAFNKQQDRMGKLFIEPFSRRIIDHPAYYTKIIHYIHANPVHHGFCKRVEDWPYSSYHQIIGKSNWLCHEEVMKWFGSLSAFKDFHQQPIQRKF